MARRHSAWRIVTACGALAAAHVWPTAAHADGEVWLWYEHRIPIVGASAEVPRVTLRIMTDTRFNGRSDGLDMAFLRVGPIVHAAPWFFVAAHATAIADRGPNGTFAQQYRSELDLNPHGSFGEFSFVDRTRLEGVFPIGERGFFRVRTMPRLTWRPANGPWLPFVADEVFFTPKADTFVTENRVFLGIGRMLSDGARLDVAYMLRTRRSGEDWVHDHGLLVSVFFGVSKGASSSPDSAESGK